MATVLLQNIGAGLGAAIGGPIGASLGRAAGGLLGSSVDQTIFGKDRVIEGQRLDGARVLSSEEGATLPRVYGRHKIAGEVIWATRFEEQKTSQQSGGKGGAPKVTTNSYAYFANFAVGICQGPVSCLRRVWADGEELDLTAIDFRFYNGTPNQLPDPLIEAKQGLNNTPAYRDLCYIVFEGLPLHDFGNRIPQLTFEVINAIGSLESEIKSMTIIPGSTEHGLDPIPRSSGGGADHFSNYNRHTRIAETDWEASIDELQAVCPNLEQVALVVTWFGDDLRAGECTLYPAVTSMDVQDWQVSGYQPSINIEVSKIDGAAAFGGTPSDQSVLNAIADLKSRGLKVVLYPFLMMDIPQGNTLPGLYGESSQPAYPWRGEISCYPAPEAVGSVDQSAIATQQLAAFRGQYETFIRHYLQLALQAGGVDGFLIGSELRSLTKVRDQDNSFPFVDALMDLAQEAKQTLGAATMVTYGADWSEYFGYQPQDGSGDVFFNLDPLWASPDIDVIGIDNYMPVSDLRSGFEPDGQSSLRHNLRYLEANISAGEGWDWYYANENDRKNGVRTPVTDGLGEPWVYRYKDLVSWWSNSHHSRIGGQRSSSPSSWVPQSKPIIFTELGCPAIDHGANQPNVFVDPKSSQSNAPYFSGSTRDDLIQRRFLEAHFHHWQDEANNPQSSVYSGSMVDAEQMFLWAWDARPFPWFPRDENTWSDGPNWQLGHWLNGRLGGCSCEDLVQQILSDYGIDNARVTLDGIVDGYVVPGAQSARAALEPLLNLFSANVREESGELIIDQSQYNDRLNVEFEDLVQETSNPKQISKRVAETDLPAEAVLFHTSIENDYEETGSKSRRVETTSERQISMSVPACMPQGMGIGLADLKLREVWQSRETLEVRLPTKYMMISVGDVLQLGEPNSGTWQITDVELGVDQRISLVKVDPSSSPFFYDHKPSSIVGGSINFGAPMVVMMDLPALNDEEVASEQFYLALAAEPWAGSYAVLTSPTENGFKLRDVVLSRATIGQLVSPLMSGPLGRIDYANVLRVSSIYGTFQGEGRLALLNGAGAMAIETLSGGYEIVQFETSQLGQDGIWILSGLLRGQLGTEEEMASGSGPGAKAILLDGQTAKISMETNDTGADLNWRIGPAQSLVNSGAYGEFSLAYAGRHHRMLSPVHLKIQNTETALHLSWTRRGRRNSDTWENAEVPLDAIAERYQLNFREPSGDLVRTVEVSEPSYYYPDVDRLSDLGSLDADFEVEIAQLNDMANPGAILRSVITQ